jgi:tRNA threonylcarbamoyladenosine biosynthesis protein TsaB
VIGVPSLLALSLNAQCDPVAVLLDARRGEAYVQSFSGPGIPIGDAAILPMDDARASIAPGTSLITSPLVDIAALARFAATADPALYPPEASYIRDADAKPQEKFRVARTGS